MSVFNSLTANTMIMTSVLASGSQNQFLDNALHALQLTGQIPEDVTTVRGAVEAIVSERFRVASQELRAIAQASGHSLTADQALWRTLTLGHAERALPEALREPGLSESERMKRLGEFLVDALIREANAPDPQRMMWFDKISAAVTRYRRKGDDQALLDLIVEMNQEARDKENNSEQFPWPLFTMSIIKELRQIPSATRRTRGFALMVCELGARKRMGMALYVFKAIIVNIGLTKDANLQAVLKAEVRRCFEERDFTNPNLLGATPELKE